MTFCILSSCLTQTINNLIYFKSLSFFTSAKTSGQEPSVNLGSQCAPVVACEQIMIMTEYSGGHSYIALFLSATSFSWVASGIFSHRKKNVMSQRLPKFCQLLDNMLGIPLVQMTIFIVTYFWRVWCLFRNILKPLTEEYMKLLVNCQGRLVNFWLGSGWDRGVG